MIERKDFRSIDVMLDDARQRFGETRVYHVPICGGFMVDLPDVSDAILVDYEAREICVEDLRGTDAAYSLMLHYRRNGFNCDLDFG